MGTAALALTAVVLLGPGSAPPPSTEDASAAVAPGFVESTVISGLTNPTVVRFSPDGRVFVAEKSGLIKVFDSVNDTTPTTFADLRTNVHNFWDRGLLGMALDPNFPASPYVYVLYTYDHILGDAAAAPKWGPAGVSSDGCPSPPGPTSDGCVVSGRLSRLQANGDVMTGSEQVLVEDWCQQYPSHSVGTVEFGPDGALYAGAGDGASFNFADYGQDGSPLNPCGDPPGGVGATLTPPTAEGGALRSQDLRTSGDPVTLDGSLIRVNPSTGAGLPTNPLSGNSDANARRIIAHGFRNPFRFAFRPGTNEIWVGDVGWNDWEEIDTIDNPADGVLRNFGWPCFEGNTRQAGYDAAGLSICQNLASTSVVDPFFKYKHTDKVVPNESCPTGSSSVAGLAFEFAPVGGVFPSAYQGALFFADYSRDCIWVMRKNGNPKPSPGSIDTFVSGAANPVNLEFGPDGRLYYVDFDGGTIRRISPTSAPPPPPPGTTFGPQVQYATGTNAHGVALGNVNGDGRLDMAVANAGNNTVTVRLGNGDGSFGSVSSYTVGSAPKSVAIADVSGDGVVDLVTANQDSVSVSVLLGNGSGGFGAATNYSSACPGTHEVAIGNYNGDGRPDIAVACWGGNNVSVLLGTGGGAFGSAITSAGGPAWSLVTRDFDRDGKMDLAVANHDSSTVGILRGNGNGTFAAPVTYPVGSGPHSIRIGDLNNDGRADLVTANDNGNTVSVLLANGNGTFAAAASYPTGLVPKGVGVGDFDRDGDWDVVTANTAGNYPTNPNNPGGDQISLLFGNGAGGLGSPSSYTVGNTPFAVAVGQLNADTMPDVVTANWFSNSASVLLNNASPPPPSGATYISDMTFTQATNGWGPVERDRSNGESAAGDGAAITLNGTGYAKGLGVHAVSDVRVSLSANCTRFKAAIGVDDEVGSNGSSVFQVFTGATQVYASPTLTGTSATVQVDVGISGATELRLVVTDGGNGIAYDHADWADARIECGSGGDTTPPTITNRTPSPGATGVAVAVSPTATFSEAMNPATLTTSTFTLVQQGQSTPLAASVSYASQVATLDPSADLLPNTTYTATVKGGASGAKDVAGNPLAADVTWSFSTAAAGTTTTYLSDLTWTSMTNGWGPVEKDRSNGEAGLGDGTTLTLNGTTYAKGLGAHAAADVTYPLSASCTRFKASVGVDDEVGSFGSVVFQVFTGATKIYDSGVMTGTTATKSVDVAIPAGSTQLRLVLTNGGDSIAYDHADWADARIEC